MKIAVLVARILLGALFLFFGLNIILQFLKMPPHRATPASMRRCWRRTGS